MHHLIPYFPDFIPPIGVEWLLSATINPPTDSHPRNHGILLSPWKHQLLDNCVPPHTGTSLDRHRETRWENRTAAFTWLNYSVDEIGFFTHSPRASTPAFRNPSCWSSELSHHWGLLIFSLGAAQQLQQLRVLWVPSSPCFFFFVGSISHISSQGLYCHHIPVLF